MMKLQILKEGTEDVLMFDVDGEMTIAQVLDFVFGVMGSNTPTMGSLLLNGSPIGDHSKTLSSFEGLDNEILIYRESVSNNSNNATITATTQESAVSRFSYWTSKLGTNDQQARKQLLDNPELLQELVDYEPELAEAALDDNTNLFERHFNDWLQRERTRQVTNNPSMTNNRFGSVDNESRMSSLSNPNVQRGMDEGRINELIRMEHIRANMEMALEHVPEAFTQVPMLFIDCEVNDHPVKAFVDSGAQATISKSSLDRTQAR
jgi:DNA damage-inducible protein 1